jgi:hypothetical protein
MQGKKTRREQKPQAWSPIEKYKSWLPTENNISKKKESLLFITDACQKTGIGYRTIKRNAPQLIESWKEEDFHW